MNKPTIFDRNLALRLTYLPENPDAADLITYSREGSYIERNHTTPAINPGVYTVGFHQSNMTQSAFVLFDDDPARLTLNLCQAINFHDSNSEQSTGDIVGSSKRIVPEFGQIIRNIEEAINELTKLMPAYLTDAEKEALAFLDYFELYVYCVEQRSLGNNAPRMVRMRTRVRELVLLFEGQFNFGVEHLINRIEENNLL